VDTSSSYAYIGMGDGTSLTEQFVAYRPSDITDATPIQPGGTMVLMSKKTTMYCRFAALTVTTPLSNSVRANKIRSLLQSGTCATQGLICDVADVSGAAVITYGGSGMSFGGVPLVQSPTTLTIITSGDPACSAPGGASFVVQLSAGAWPQQRRGASSSSSSMGADLPAGACCPLPPAAATCAARDATLVRCAVLGLWRSGLPVPAPRLLPHPTPPPPHPPTRLHPRRHPATATRQRVATSSPQGWP
jgi:hypothetical protein